MNVLANKYQIGQLIKLTKQKYDIINHPQGQNIKFIKLQRQKSGENEECYDGKAFGEQYFSCVGMIQSIWLDRQSITSRPEKCLYGTAFLIKSTIITTCSHNIYDPQQKRVADKVKFIPGQNGYNISQKTVYNVVQFKFLPFERVTTLDLNPTINDLCICRLQEPVYLRYYIPIQCYIPPQHANLTLIAYPNKGYRYNFHNLMSICLDRRHSNGKMVAISKDIISYEIETEQGCSGGPVLAKNESNIYLVGMHSHSGGYNKNINEGLFFNSKTYAILNFLMQSLQNESKLMHKNDTFPHSIELVLSDNQIRYQGQKPLNQQDNYLMFTAIFDQYHRVKEISQVQF